MCLTFSNDEAAMIRKRMCVHSIKRCLLNPTETQGVSMPFLVHDSFTSLVMMEEERELERDFKVKGKFKIENIETAIVPRNCSQ